MPELRLDVLADEAGERGAFGEESAAVAACGLVLLLQDRLELSRVDREDGLLNAGLLRGLQHGVAAVGRHAEVVVMFDPPRPPGDAHAVKPLGGELLAGESLERLAAGLEAVYLAVDSGDLAVDLSDFRQDRVQAAVLLGSIG